ncbi:MAG: WG repeat-containing protein [Eubacterium sp.]|jgi:hypothetical protein|nr:WG repeat-containing protein [Eubacterium sp.]
MKNRVQVIIAGFVSAITSVSLLFALSSCSDGVVPILENSEDELSGLPNTREDNDPSQTLPNIASPEPVKTMQWLVEPKYDSIGDFHDGYCVVVIENLYGIIDETGKEIIPCKYRFLAHIGNNYFMSYGNTEDESKNGNISYNSSRTIIDDNENVIISSFGDPEGSIDNFFFSGESFICNYTLKGSTGAEMYDLDGTKILTNNNYSEILKTNQQDAYIANIVRNHGIEETYVLINNKGEEISKEYEEMRQFQEDLSFVRDNSGKWGCINKEGEEVIKPVYDDLIDYTFVDGRAIVYKAEEELYMQIDTKGNVLQSNNDLFAMLNTDSNIQKIIDEGGYENIPVFYDGIAMVVKDNKAGFVDSNGTVICAPTYAYDPIGDANSALYSFNDGRAIVKRVPNIRYSDGIFNSNSGGILRVYTPEESVDGELPYSIIIGGIGGIGGFYIEYSDLENVYRRQRKLNNSYT